MIRIQHVQDLERKVLSALSLIKALREENAGLKQKLDGYEERVGELEALVQDFKADQGAIEEGILRALKQLDTLEDAVTGLNDSGANDSEEIPDAALKVESEVEPDDSGTIEPDAETEPAESSAAINDDPETVDEDKPDSGESELDIF
jgi:chromosome segregation ATPase